MTDASTPPSRNPSPGGSGKPRTRSARDWELPRPFGWKTLGTLFLVLAFLSWSGVHVEMDTMVAESSRAAGNLVGLTDESQVVSGFSKLFREMFPPTISRSTPVERLTDFDPDNPPPFSRIETREYFEVEIDYDTLRQDITVIREQTLVEPLGYLGFVLVKMAETLEIGLWGTIVAVLLSIPLAFFSARNYSPHPILYGSARGLVSFFRSIPELVSALFFVLAFGFGPVAGILALGFHCTGFLGKFYAEDIENAERGPQEALFALGASRLKVLRVAVLPQVIPQYIAYTLYILDRNVRMATVIGIVGAGGIGQELKGRWDIFNYSHVATILIVLFLTVLVLDQLSAKVRARLIQ